MISLQQSWMQLTRVSQKGAEYFISHFGMTNLETATKNKHLARLESDKQQYNLEQNIYRKKLLLKQKLSHRNLSTKPGLKSVKDSISNKVEAKLGLF